MQTLGQALEPVVHQVVAADRGQREAGRGDLDAVGTGTTLRDRQGQTLKISSMVGRDGKRPSTNTRQRATRRMANVVEETEGVSDVDMTENRDIPDYPDRLRHFLCQKAFLANALRVYI